jgi:two-component system chemotaxis sensor kinase CheA
MDMDILQDYLPEARELLEKAQEDTLRLEADPGNDDILASVFRAFHTLKGGAGFLEADHLVGWTHHLEDLLDKLRSHTLSVTPVMVDAILKGMDVITDMLQQLAQGSEPTAGPGDLGRVIQQLAAGQNKDPLPEPNAARKATTVTTDMGTPSPSGPASASSDVHCDAASTLCATQRPLPDGQPGIFVEQTDASAPDAPNAAITPQEFEAALDTLYGQNAPGLSDSPENVCQERSEITQDEFEQALTQLYGNNAPGYASLVAPAPEADPENPVPSAIAPDKTASVAAPPQPIAPAAARNTTLEVADSTLRVDAQRLDAVMNQVGELILLRNRLASAVSSLTAEDEGMSRIAREMDLTVNDMQNTMTHLRMQPCKRLFQQLPRVVRDTSRQLGKAVRLDISGEDVEIDKTVVDALSGPMTHLIRNSLDHGVETPTERKGTGKSREAQVKVAAIHMGDKVRIEVSDDGRGIDQQFVTQKAIEKGIITAEQAARLSEQEAIELIFRAGFSTNDQVTDIPGRGVGMDVVKEIVRKLRGRLDVQTRLGRGTTITMEFPLTLAVLPVLYLRLRRDIYAMPISLIEGLIDIDTRRIHRMAGQTTYRTEGTQVVPLLDLGALLQHAPLNIQAESIEGVLTERGIFMVSEVLGNEDSVVKPIDFLTDQNWYQGATISGKGNVVLILDASALSHAAQTIAEGVI